MDTNASQAIKMAGGILIAITIIATLTYSFSKFSPFQQQLEDIQALEQTADFNKEYEVYNKNLMLGIDVISAINKAYSNNVKYIEAYGYSDDIRDNYMVDIKIEDGLSLTQSLDLKLLTPVYNNGTLIKVTEQSIDVENLEKDDSRIELAAFVGNGVTQNTLQNFWEKEIGSVALIDESETNYTNEKIYSLIILNTELKKTLNNNNEDTKEDWSKAILETYAYSMKTKKFKCTGVKISEQTGRIIEIHFKEIQ